jgi:catechol 2,3-dioxygenase-like lactoylglutathione lyase family enzyme
MLGRIRIVTICAPDLGATAEAYQQFLNYSVVDKGVLAADLAAVWNAPKMAGHNYLTLQPASQADVYLRLIQNDPVEGFAAMRTFGWNANEILTQDPDVMAERLEGSPFEVIGPPANLSTSKDIRAMQAVGLAGEVIYLTRLPQSGDASALGRAETFVDRTFIVVVGGPDMQAMQRFYHDVLGLPVSEPVGARIRVLSRAHGMSMDTNHPLSIARLPRNFLIEIDQYPQTATARTHRQGELPPGMAMVAFTTPSLDELGGRLLAAPAAIESAPYAGRRVGVIRGAAGELIELLEQQP